MASSGSREARVLRVVAKAKKRAERQHVEVQRGRRRRDLEDAVQAVMPIVLDLEYCQDPDHFERRIRETLRRVGLEHVLGPYSPGDLYRYAWESLEAAS